VIDPANDLPSLRPAEIGNRWFGKATSDFSAGAKIGRVDLIAHVGSSVSQVDVTLGASPVRMRFGRIDSDSIPLTTILGATRNEAGILLIDYQDCES
jgi:hypothetical protein